LETNAGSNENLDDLLLGEMVNLYSAKMLQCVSWGILEEGIYMERTGWGSKGDGIVVTGRLVATQSTESKIQ
jgi:hypothetical protein